MDYSSAGAGPAPGTSQTGDGGRDVGDHERRLHAWLARRDPGLRAAKRSVRAAVLVPAVFAIAEFGTANNQTPLFTLFGSVALLLFADFGGPRRLRARSYVGLWVVGAVFITVGTLCSNEAVTAVVGMAVAAFAVLFAGVVSPQAVAGSTAALLTFVLPVCESAPASAIPDRLAGWALAGACCIPAALFVWAERWHDPLRHALADGALALADLATAAAAAGDVATARLEVGRALPALREQYEATPYRPTGAGPTDVALTNLVARLEWAADCAVTATGDPPPLTEATRVAAVESASADVLVAVADLLVVEDPQTQPRMTSHLSDAVDRLVVARRAATDAALASLAVDPGPARSDGPLDVPGGLTDVDPTYPVRMLAFALEMLADIALTALGPPRDGSGRVARMGATLRSFGRVAAGHLTFRSVWLRNSVRGTVALALAVVVVEATTVEHGFWVVLGTLSVLRSNALGTGSTALRAVLGTTIGFLVGYVVLLALGNHDAELWLVLPVAVLVAGIAPTTISFTAGQAGFTVLVVIAFNIIDPVGSRIGLVRVEDVLIGAGVSAAVGLLFWPRGAGAQLARSLGQAYAAAMTWLVVAVDQVGRVAADVSGTGWGPERTAAMDASRRLDDAYRQYLAERGAKRLPLALVTQLLIGNARIRLTAATLEELPYVAVPGSPAPLPEVVAARSAVTGECAAVESWFDRFTTSLGTRDPQAPPTPAVDVGLPGELAEAWTAVRRAGRRDGVFAVLRLLWVEERMDDLRRLQAHLSGTMAGPRP